MDSADYRSAAEFLSDYRWVLAAIASSFPEGSKEYKGVKGKINQLANVRAKLEAAAAMAEKGG